MGVWKERIDKILILNCSTSLSSIFETSSKLEIIPPTYKRHIKMIKYNDQYRDLHKFMSSEIIPAEYGGKVKKVTWPPQFNKKIKAEKLADLFFIKMEYGIRPFFSSQVDFNSYNSLNRDSESHDLFNFIPKNIVLEEKDAEEPADS